MKNKIIPFLRKAGILAVFALAGCAAQTDSISDVETTDYRTECPLCHAARNGDIVEVNRLLADGVDANVIDKQKYTPLMNASFNGHAEVAKVLLAAGASPNLSKKDRGTALMMAAGVGHAEVAKMLLTAGATANAMDKNQFTALHFAVIYGHLEIVKMLLAAGANPNVVEKNNFLTALHFAAFTGNAEIAKMLLADGANPNSASHAGLSPLHIAVERGNTEMVKILLSGGASVNQKENKGFTALDFAEFRGLSEIVRILQSPERYRNYDITPSRQNANPDAIQSPQTANIAESVFANVWKSIVVVKSGDSQGSGVIVRPDIVATNCHVLDDEDIAVYKHDNRRASTDTIYNAFVIKRDDYRDFCLLWVLDFNGSAAKVRRYDSLGIGEDVYAIGSPKGLDLSLSSGLISQLRQGKDRRWIQTDAAISPGSSGGGLFDSDGNLIGITTEKVADENVEGIGFAIPADLILEY